MRADLVFEIAKQLYQSEIKNAEESYSRPRSELFRMAALAAFDAAEVFVELHIARRAAEREAEKKAFLEQEKEVLLGKANNQSSGHEL